MLGLSLFFVSALSAGAFCIVPTTRVQMIKNKAMHTPIADIIPSHPVNRNIQRNSRDANGLYLTTEEDNEEISHTYSLKERNPYDVHVYYDGPEERERAMNLREKMQQEFNWMRFYSPKDRPIGPHPIPMWEADFGGFGNRLKWNIVKEFLEKEHDTLSVLIHPHSTDGDFADHTKNAFWIGEVQALRIQGWN